MQTGVFLVSQMRVGISRAKTTKPNSTITGMLIRSQSYFQGHYNDQMVCLNMHFLPPPPTILNFTGRCVGARAKKTQQSKAHLMHTHMKVAVICFSVSIPRWLFGCVCQSEGGNKKAEESVAAMGSWVHISIIGVEKKKKKRKVCNILVDRVPNLIL